MAYGVETKIQPCNYALTLRHNSTGFVMTITVLFDGTQSHTDAQRDSLFQAFLTKVGELQGATVLSANKQGTYSQPVTP